MRRLFIVPTSAVPAVTNLAQESLSMAALAGQSPFSVLSVAGIAYGSWNLLKGSFLWSSSASDELNQDLILAIRSQLDRCGPESLRCPAIPNCEQAIGLWALAACFVAGTLVGLLLACGCFYSWARFRVQPNLSKTNSIRWSALSGNIRSSLTSSEDEQDAAADVSSQALARWAPPGNSASRLIRRGGTSS